MLRMRTAVLSIFSFPNQSPISNGIVSTSCVTFALHTCGGQISSMRAPPRWRTAVVLLMYLLQISTTRCDSHSEEQQRSRGKQEGGGAQEADEDAIFAAAMLGLVYDRVRDTGDVFRIIGDTAGGLAGGSIKLLSASVNGLASGLDAASRGLKGSVRPQNEQPSTSSPRSSAVPNKNNHAGEQVLTPDISDETLFVGTTPNTEEGKLNEGDSADSESGRGSPDPFDRIGSVALTSLAGSLKILSTAVGGVGDAVFQAGMLAEGLGEGTGRVAEDTVRVVQRFVGWARDDIVKLNGRKHQGQDSTKGSDAVRPRERPSFSPTEQSVDDTESDGNSQTPTVLAASFTFIEVCKGMRDIGHYTAEAAFRGAVTLLQRKNGALPPATRLAIFMLLALFVSRARTGRRNSTPSEVTTPRRNVLPAQNLLARNEMNRGSPSTAMAVAAAGLYSPSRSLFTEPRQAPDSPIRRDHDIPPADGLDPSLPSPAQARAAEVRAAQALTGQARDSRRQGLSEHGERQAEDEILVPQAAPEAGTSARWRWWPIRRFREPRRISGGGGGGDDVYLRRRPRYILWLILLWLVASVLEERERERVAWLAWDEGYRQGQASRAIDPTVEAETAAWLNHILTRAWGGTKGTAAAGRRDEASDRTMGLDSGGYRKTGIFSSDGLSSLVAEHLAEAFLAALEEMKPTSVVGVELLGVELGSSAPRVLGIKVLDPSSSASPGSGDGRCCRRGECVSLRVDLEVATQGLRVGVRVKASNLENALLPTGTVSLLEVYFRGSISVRAELRDEFPFVGKAFVALDDTPDFQMNLEPWGLDEWARIALQQAIAPYVLPGFMEVDAALALCPDCPTTVALAPHTAVAEREEKADADTRLPSFRLPARAAAAIAQSLPLTPTREVVGGVAGSQSSLGGKKERYVDKGPQLGNMAGSSNNDRKRGRLLIDEDSPFASAAGATSALEAGGDHGGKFRGAKKQRVVGGQETIGRAAAMTDLHEYRSGTSGPLQWLKNRLSSGITSTELPDDGHWPMDWEGMD